MDYSLQAVQAALQGEKTFCKFLSANDTGQTGGHQAGIYVAKPAVPILFEQYGQRGQNMDRWVSIEWQDGTVTNTRYIYYGQGTRNEYRITNFGHDFPFLRPELTGALFVLVQNTHEDYSGFVLETEDEINRFLDAFGISVTETNRLIDTATVQAEVREEIEFTDFIAGLNVDFPASHEISRAAREIEDTVFDHSELVRTNPDEKLISWTREEFRLFRALEHARYDDIISQGFSNIDEFIETANQMLNRRKSRAGKSLEHHLAAIFDGNGLEYQAQAVTEGNKRPDFLFPSGEAYHDPSFPDDRLVFLGAKTTCKDRWRQIINEAERFRQREKFLCTLQQGISSAQMDEMQEEHVILVVPRPYIRAYPRDRQNRIWTLERFVHYVKEISL